MEKMWCFEDDMDSRGGGIPSGSASSASGYSLRSRGSGAKISPFCPRSSSKLTQSLVKDHMISHYRKIYSAKAAIDTSVPKSLLYSVKYQDQLRRSGTKSSVRPQSARSHSRVSCSTTQSRLSLQSEHRPYLSSRTSSLSTPRPCTSFHPRSTVYPTHNSSHNSSHHPSRRPHSSPALSLNAGGLDPQNYKSFQDPLQKTYSGDLLQKHASRFTPNTPFTPKTLRTHNTSYLSQSRSYRAPQRSSRVLQDRPDHSAPQRSSRVLQDSPDHSAPQRSSRVLQDSPDSSSRNRKSKRQQQEEPSPSSEEDDWSAPYRPDSELQHMTHPDYRVSHHSTKSQVSRISDAEEEELKCLEFVTAVTDDILSRGFVSDRVVERVINRHIDLNRFHLKESKMRHLVEILRKDIKEPNNSPINTLNFDEENHFINKTNSSSDDTDLPRDRTTDFTSPGLASTRRSGSEKTFVLEPIDLNEEERGSLSPHQSKRCSFMSEEELQHPRVDEKGNDALEENKYSSFSEEEETMEKSDDSAVSPERERPRVDEKGSDALEESVNEESEHVESPERERRDVDGLGTALESLKVSDDVASVSDDDEF